MWSKLSWQQWAVVVLALMAVAERVWFDFGPNIELVTTASVLAGMYMSAKWRWMVPVGVMAAGDLVLGLGAISWFTWSGFVVMAFLPSLMKKLDESKWVYGTVSGLVGNLVFYGWTNLGVWATEKWGMYPNTLAGLGEAYVMGLPFLRLQIVSTLLFLPLSIWVIEEVVVWSKARMSEVVV